jgi:hypothetical protein
MVWGFKPLLFIKYKRSHRVGSAQHLKLRQSLSNKYLRLATYLRSIEREDMIILNYVKNLYPLPR